MDAELSRALWALEADDAVRVIVVTGAGRAFCSGLDLTQGAEAFGPDAEAEHEAKTGSRSDDIHERTGFWRMATPIIGALNGLAVGAGLTLPLLFDLRVVAEDARYQFVFTRRGILPDANSTWLLARMVGVERALDLLLTGREFDGREAVAYGLALQAVPAERVLAAAQDIARSIAANAAPAAVGLTKRLVYHHLEVEDRAEAMALETKLSWWIGTQPDVMEGIAAWVQRRPPAWSMPKRPALPDGLEFG
jgi:enoyl-CoA hydratase/carnithine racemase